MKSSESNVCFERLEQILNTIHNVKDSKNAKPIKYSIEQGKDLFIQIDKLVKKSTAREYI